MLPDPTIPASLLAVLENLRWVFTAPSFATFAAMVTGLIAQTGKGTVTGMLTGAGLARIWSHDRAHAFFSRAAWNADTLGIVPVHADRQNPAARGAALTVAVDDTLFKRAREEGVRRGLAARRRRDRGQAGRVGALLRGGRDHR